MPTSGSTSSAPTRACWPSSRTYTDDQIKSLRRGGHDYRKVYAAYRRGGRAHGSSRPSILAQTVKGWTLGPGVEARNITHQAKKLNEQELRIFRDRLELPIPDEKLKDAPYYRPGAGLAGAALPPASGARRWAARCPGGWSSASRWTCRRPVGVRQLRRRVGDPGGLDHDGLRAAAAGPDPRPGHRQAHRAHHPRRGTHVRPGPAVQGGRHLRRARPALRPGRLQPGAVLPRGDRRPGAGGGHHRGRLVGLASRRRARPTPRTASR